jgi:hypothetical protein
MNHYFVYFALFFNYILCIIFASTTIQQKGLQLNTLMYFKNIIFLNHDFFFIIITSKLFFLFFFSIIYCFFFIVFIIIITF